MKLKASILGLLLLSCLFMIDCAPPPAIPAGGAGLFLEYRGSDLVEVRTAGMSGTLINCKVCVGVNVPTPDIINSEEIEDICSNGHIEHVDSLYTRNVFNQAAFINNNLNGDPSQLSENNYSGEIWCNTFEDNFYRGTTTRLTYNGSGGGAGGGAGGAAGGAAGGPGGGGTPPFDPTGLVANPIAAQVNLTWLDNAIDETGYKIERADDDGFGNPLFYGQIDSIGANMTTYSDTTGVSTTVYWYRVKASNGAGDSNYSNEVSVTYP